MSLPSTWRGSWWSPRRWSSPRPSGRRWSWSWFTQCGFFITNQKLLLTLRTSLLRAWPLGSTCDTCVRCCHAITVQYHLSHQCDMLQVWQGTECFVSALPHPAPPVTSRPRPSGLMFWPAARRSVWLLIGQLGLSLASHWSVWLGSRRLCWPAQATRLTAM